MMESVLSGELVDNRADWTP